MTTQPTDADGVSHIREGLNADASTGEETPRAEGSADDPQEGTEPQTVETPPATTQTTATPESTEAQPAERTYTEEAWKQAINERTSVLQTQASDANKRTTEALAENSRLQAEVAEERAQYQDLRAVESGEITDGQAVQNQNNRREAVQGEQRQREQQYTNAAIYDRQVTAGRQLKAFELSQEHGVDMKVLMDDETLTSVPLMAKAAEMIAKEKLLDEREAALVGTEKFDSGQVGSAGVNVDDMSAEEKIAWSLAHPPKVTSRS